MFESVRRHQRIFLGLILVLIIPSFVVVGAWDLIAPGSDSGTVATVGRQKIQKFEWERSHQQRIDQVRAQLGGRIDPNLLDTQASRLSTLEDLVTQQVLLHAAESLRVRISDEQMRRTIAAIPAVQKDGRFDMDLYQQVLKAQGLTAEGFEQRVRADLALELAPAAIGRSTIVPRSVARRLTQSGLETRVVRVKKFPIAEALAGIQVSDAELQAFYQANSKNFQTPEEVDIVLVGFSKPASADQVEQFSNLVYEQSDSLEPAARKFNLPIQTVKSVRRQGSDEARPAELQRIVGHPKMLQALFSADVLVNKRNTEAVEIAPGVLASARVIAHRPAAPIPMDRVRAQIERQLREQKAAERVTGLAQNAAKELTPGSALPGLAAAKTLSRADSQKPAGVLDLPAEVIAAVFAADVKSLPAAISVPASAKTAAAWLVVIESTAIPALDSPAVKEAVARELQRLEMASTQDALERWISFHRQAIGVKTYPEKLAKTDSR